nr:unnamed protein product [Callosobruchus chinensis]
MKQLFQYGVKDMSINRDRVFISLSYSPRTATLKRKFGNLPVRYMRVRIEKDEDLKSLDVCRYHFNPLNEQVEDLDNTRIKGGKRKFYLQPPTLLLDDDDNDDDDGDNDNGGNDYVNQDGGHFNVKKRLGYQLKKSKGAETIPNETAASTINLMIVNMDIGLLEVDLKYPIDLFPLHKDLLLCPEHLAHPTSNSEMKRLLITMYDKSKYVILYRNLKQAVQLDMIVDKIHRYLKFKQAPSIKMYIDMNTELRTHSRNEFEKNFFELMNSSLYGKTIDNVKRYRDIKLLTKWSGRYGAKYYISQLDKYVVVIEMKKLKVKFNKPIFVGMAIMEISKIFLYDFRYNYIK